MVSKLFSLMWQEAMEHNVNNIVSLLDKDANAKVADIGCGDGKLTIRFKQVTRCRSITGVDGQRDRLKAAKIRGVDKIVFANLGKSWPLAANSFDAVVSNQVIEHIVDIDHFIIEIFRILKPGGYAVISTENLSSWHNVAALLFGFQDFSHHLIRKKHIGNPFSLHYGEKTASWSAKDHSGVDDSTYPHMKIFTYKSLIAAFETYGFRFEKGIGSGYYPLSGSVGFFASRIDPYHSHFITIKIRKP